jgi:hypothetical protein
MRLFDRNSKSSIEDKEEFKEAVTSLVLTFSSFLNKSILLSEKFWDSDLLVIRKEFVTSMIENIQGMMKKMNNEFKKTISRTIKEVENYAHCPDISDLKTDFEKESKEISMLFSRLKKLPYDEKLNSNPTFLRKLCDFVTIAKPDGKFEIPHDIDLEKFRDEDLEGVSGELSGDEGEEVEENDRFGDDADYEVSGDDYSFGEDHGGQDSDNNKENDTKVN